MLYLPHHTGGCMENKKVFAFDLGKTSIGYCARCGHDIQEAESVIIDIDHADAASLRDRRRIFRTLNAHKAREKYFDKIWQDCNLEILSKDDKKFTKEFAAKGDSTIYNSCLLRIALLQNRKLETWQIYKALHNAMQRRGYDPNLAWKSAQTDDDKENLELAKKYTQENGEELIQNENYKYPCYYDALRLGMWSEDSPDEFKPFNPQQNFNKVRATNYVAPRNLVEKELTALWTNAQKQLPELKKYTPEEFLYGEYREAYGSYVNPDYRKYLGSEHDWQGVLGQKIPRFDNRIISKCKLLPKRNVCKANTLENVTLVLLLKLKNLRITNGSGDKVRLSPSDINTIYQNWLVKTEGRANKLDTTITKKEIEDVIGQKIIDKIEPMKADISGRSSFCRRACQIMTDIILSGELYPQNMKVSKYIDPQDTKDGITEEEIRTMLSKIGDWNNLYIPDNRNENAAIGENTREKTDLMIGGITNPVVRNRLQIFRDLLFYLAEKYGKPDEVIFEFVREGADNSLFGRIKAQSAESYMKNQEKENNQIKQELVDANALSPTNFEKAKLLKIQGGKCIYSGQPIAISDFDKCEIDHIYPRTMGGNDALYNKVLCFRAENQKKQGRTPYEWLSKDKEIWANYVNRLNDIKKQLGKKKYELLTSKPQDCEKLIESYNGLAETSHIAKIAQQITAFTFGWGLQVEGESRHIFVNNGATTFAIRKRYGLNAILGDAEKKNRQNDKHHSLDAICISYAREFKYDKTLNKDVIEGFNPDVVKKVIDGIIPYPYANKKALKSNTRPLETIYGKRIINGKACITNRVTLESLEPKDKKVKNIVDEVIKTDLLNKLEQKPSADEWYNYLKDYIHPKKKTKVKKVMIVVSEGTLEQDSNGRDRIGEYCDYGTKGTKGQFKCSKGHKGQILYYNDKGAVKVMPVYSNKKTQEVRDKLVEMGCKLYAGGQMFYSGCLVNIPNDFKAGAATHPAGVYKLRTIKSKGDVKLENNNGIEIDSSVKNLTDANFKKHSS